MSAPSSLADYIGSLPEATPTASPAPDPMPSAPSVGEDQGQPPVQGEQQPAIKPIGFKDTQDEQQSKPEEGQAPFTLAEGVAPDLVVGMSPDGKPITAAEVSQGYLRQADYTRKTQEMSEFRKTAEPAVEFVKQNWTFIEGLSSDDPQTRLNTILDIAKSNGVDLSGISKQNNRERDPSGKFVSSQPQQAEGAFFDLSQYEEDSEAYALASAANTAIQGLSQKVDQIGQKFEGYLSKTEQQQQRVQAETAMTGIAREWQDAGMQGIDLQGAMSLVGQPLSPDQAMIVHHFERILAHQLAAARVAAGAQPNEPASIPGSGVSPSGMAMHQYIDQRLR